MTDRRKIIADDGVFIFLIALVLYTVASFATQAMKTDGNAVIFVRYLLPQVFYLGTTFVYFKIRRVEFSLLKKENVRLVHYPVAILFGLGMFFAGLLPMFGINSLFNALNLSPTVVAPTFVTAWDYVFGVAVICILPSLGEELVFRKVLCDGFADYGGSRAVLLSGLVFSLSHLNLAQTVYQFLLGCALAYLYMKTKNITLTVIIHFINNVLALFLSGITGAEFWNNIITLSVSFAIGAVLIVGGIVYLVKKTPSLERKKSQKLSIFTVGLLVFLAVLWFISAIVGSFGG